MNTRFGSRRGRKVKWLKIVSFVILTIRPDSKLAMFETLCFVNLV